VLAQLPAQVRWISAEPLLGHIDILAHATQPNWVVAGGESGPGARPMHPDWARSLRDQCAAVGIAFLFKQWGAWAAEGQRTAAPVRLNLHRRRWCTFENGEDRHARLAAAMHPIGKKKAGRFLDGALHDAMPEAVHVR